VNEIEIQGKKLYNAIDVYEKLTEGKEKKTPYQKWIFRQITGFGFIEHKDFWTVLSKSTGGRPKTDWYVTLHTAIQLCMVDRSEKGRKVRDYYIEVDEKYRSQLLRDSTKLTRRGLTDLISDSGEAERTHGHAYSLYTKLIYKKLGIEYIKVKNFRDTLSPEQLKAVEALENIAQSYLKMGYDYSTIKQALPDCILQKQRELENDTQTN
jgi:phage anti-repressor protein